MASDALPPGSTPATVTVTVRPLVATVLGMVRTRCELLHADLKEEQQNLVAQLRLTVIAGASGLLCAIAALACVVLAVPEQYRVGVLGAFVLGLGGLTIWSWQLRSEHVPRPTLPFRRLLDQLQRDADALTDRGRPERPDPERPDPDGPE